MVIAVNNRTMVAWPIGSNASDLSVVLPFGTGRSVQGRKADPRRAVLPIDRVYA
jgi:hypothetical protein